MRWNRAAIRERGLACFVPPTRSSSAWLARVANNPIVRDSGDFCVMSASFVSQLNQRRNDCAVCAGPPEHGSAQQVVLPVDRDPRRAGRAQYSVGASLGSRSADSYPSRTCRRASRLATGLTTIHHSSVSRECLPGRRLTPEGGFARPGVAVPAVVCTPPLGISLVIGGGMMASRDDLGLPSNKGIQTGGCSRFHRHT